MMKFGSIPMLLIIKTFINKYKNTALQQDGLAY